MPYVPTYSERMIPAEREGFSAGSLISPPPCPYESGTTEWRYWTRGYFNGQRYCQLLVKLYLEEKRKGSDGPPVD